MLSLADVRTLALALPLAEESPHFEATSFRVKGKIFATMGEEAGRVTLKFNLEDQHNLVASHTDTIAPVDGYWGRSGWTTVIFGTLEPDFVTVLLRMSWASVAPKKLLQQHP
jgi:predicted DNA-binding protein (MmcQ/YjbR family)